MNWATNHIIINGWICQGVSCTDGARSIWAFNMPASTGHSVRVLRNKYEYRQEERIKVTLRTCAACLCCISVLLKDLTSGPRKRVPKTRKRSKSMCIRDRSGRIVDLGLSRASVEVHGILSV